MTDHKTKSVLQFMSENSFSGDPKVLLKTLIFADLQEIDSLGGINNVKDRLKCLASLRGLAEANFIELPNDESGHTDGSQININVTHSEARQLFTWAHEIIHSYFIRSTGVKVDCFGDEFHSSSENEEEESLCDYGASQILLYGHIPGALNISSLLEIINATGASPEATALSMLDHFDDTHGLIIWMRKCKKGENPDQTSLFAEDIKHPFRIDYAVSKNAFLPKNKSVNEGDAVDQCETAGSSSGEIILDLKGHAVTLMTENLSISNGRILSLFKLV